MSSPIKQHIHKPNNLPMNNGKLKIHSYGMPAAYSALGQDSACWLWHRHLMSVDGIRYVRCASKLMTADGDQGKTVSAP